jgi:hypothetical protein
MKKTTELLTKKSFTTLTGLNYHMPDVHLQKPAIFVEDAIKIFNQIKLPVASKIKGIKKIITDKKEELSKQLNGLPKNDKNPETIRQKQILTHSVLVLIAILREIENDFSV